MIRKIEINETNNIKDTILEIYSSLSEAQLLHYYEPNPGIFIAESPIVIERALTAGYIPLSVLIEDKVIEAENNQTIIKKCDEACEKAQVKELSVYVAGETELVGITGYKLTRGMLCAMKRKPLISPEELCASIEVIQGCDGEKNENETNQNKVNKEKVNQNKVNQCSVIQKNRRIAILEDVVNPTNVGAIVRSAAALNIDAIMLTSACADPLYRRAIRVSMGTIFQVPWTVIPNGEWPDKTIEKLHEEGYKIASMALKENTKSIADPMFKKEEKLAIVLGTEGEGLKDHTIELSDYTVKIPMSHGVDSLNVAAASAVAFWQLAN